MSKKIRMAVLGTGIILFFGLLLSKSFLLVHGLGFASLSEIVDTPTPSDAIIDGYLKEIEEYDKELKKTLSSDAKNYYEGMKKYAETKIAERRDQLSNMSIYSNRKETAIVQATLSPIPKGKNVKQLGLLREADFKTFPGVKFLNGWVAEEGNSYVIYLAGYLEGDPEQGVIFVIHDATWEKEKYISPTKDGSYKINGFEKKRLILTTSKGKDKYFDTLEKKYADTLNGPVIDVTVTPTLPAYP